MSDAVKAHTDAHSLVVFSSDWCPYCKQVIQAIDDAGLDAHVVEVDGGVKSALMSMTGKSSVPQVFIGDKYIGGCNDGPESWMGTIPNLRKGKVQRWVKDLEKERGGAAPAAAAPAAAAPAAAAPAPAPQSIFGMVGALFGGAPAPAAAPATGSPEVSIQWCGG